MGFRKRERVREKRKETKKKKAKCDEFQVRYKEKKTEKLHYWRVSTQNRIKNTKNQLDEKKKRRKSSAG